jgi:ribonuclease-3
MRPRRKAALASSPSSEAEPGAAPTPAAGADTAPAASPGAAPAPPDPEPPGAILPHEDLPLVEGRALEDDAPPGPAQPLGSPGASLHALEAAVGYTFRDLRVLQRAMVHRSYLHDVPDFPLGSNERLEFLGDAVLGFLVARWLYLRHPDKQEGELTALRGALVRLTRLSTWAALIDLGAYLYLSRGEEIQGGRTRATITGRAFEALLGALYLDGGLRVVERVLKRFLAATSESDIAEALRADYKSLLQRQVQAIFKSPPVYRLAGTSGPAHQRLFHMEVWSGERLLGTGEGRNKQQAEQAAAQAALARQPEWEPAAHNDPAAVADDALEPPPALPWMDNPEVF